MQKQLTATAAPHRIIEYRSKRERACLPTASSDQLLGSPSGIFMMALPDAEQEKEEEEELPYEISSLRCYSFTVLFYTQLL